MNLKPAKKRHGKPRASEIRTVETVRLGYSSDGIFDCNNATSASSDSKNFVMSNIRASPLDTDNLQ